VVMFVVVVVFFISVKKVPSGQKVKDEINVIYDIFEIHAMG